MWILRRRGGEPGSMRQSRPSCGEVTHAEPPPTAMPESHSLSIGIRSEIRFVSGSIRVTVRSLQLRNQTPSAPAASVLTRFGTAIFATIRPVAGSRR